MNSRSARLMPLLRISQDRRPAGFLAVLLSMIGGGLFTIAGFLLYYLSSSLTTAYPPLIWSGPEMPVVIGQGRQVADHLEIEPVNNTVFFRFSAKGFMARPYDRLVWRIHGINPAQEVRLVWQIQSDSGNARQLLVQFSDLQTGSVQLRSQPDWQGYIVSLGLFVRGPFLQPLRIEKVELWPAPLSAAALLDQAWQEWTTSEYWSQRSAHFISGAPYRSLFHPVVMTAAWIGLSIILYVIYQFFAWPQQRWQFSPFMVLFLIGWGVLDVRWQMDLTQRTMMTYQRFSGKNAVEKRQSADDGELFQFLQKIRSYLPIQPVRIFVVNNDVANRKLLRNYMTARTRYHLQPHNSFAQVGDWSQLGEARPGDYILVLQPDKGARQQQTDLRYRHAEHSLQWSSGSLPVEHLYREALGQLLRVKPS